ncbi:hypothetical protein J8J14_12720 [Roseomonas sp. SSH11]|uniref:General stress protein 17M-like domain-containing protein n=1 Tax=Pararoseomonas baculiformis TaxID=2820812 RepID=A0ABS4AF51_9PROT|nr:hypothetical protein [Pararoseomonas baculiformis]MBP0445640.1 hypothetical protein [Pararoseomonas baculiformis]
MSRVISAVFDNRDEAESVVTHLRVHDRITSERIQVHPAENAQLVENEGILPSLGHLLIGDSERRTYTEAVRRGSTVVTAEVDDGIAEHVMAVFNRHGAIDLEQRAASWREEGWRDDPEFASEADLPVNSSMAAGAASMAGTGVPMVDPDEPVTGPGSGLRR